MVFASREDAGRQLGQMLKDRQVNCELVLGLPRGGVIVAAAVATVLNMPLDVLIVRKIGHPLHREFAVGALAEGDVVVLDERVVGSNPIIRFELQHIIAEEKERLLAYESRFHMASWLDLTARSVLLVDDGLATGATAEAAVLSARRRGARSAIVAAPVASTNAVTRLQPHADEVLAVVVDPDFEAVGSYYEAFAQTTDEEVLQLLNAA
jgi:predicted phosphoribosyltransferase